MVKLSTKNTVLSYADIDSSWLFEYLLNLNEKLLGQDVKILSPLSSEKTPSFSVYKKGDRPYSFTCFSTGLRGSPIDLLIHLEKARDVILTRAQAKDILIKAYEGNLRTGHVIKEERKIINGKGKVTGYEVRRFTKEDYTYWNDYCITPVILDEYNVSPLKSFTMRKLKNGVEEEYLFEGELLFGYFDNRGELFEIYNPKNRKNKCIKVIPGVIKGLDQCTGHADNWLVTEALKDVMGFRAMEIDNWHYVGSDSANIMLPAKYMAETKVRYKRRYSLFDNFKIDDAGRRAALKYKEMHQVEPLPFDLGDYKDITDMIKGDGGGITKIKLLQVL